MRFSLIIPRRVLVAAALALGPVLAVLPAQGSGTDQVTEFTINGLKVLVKQRPSAQTVSAGVFFAGGRAGPTAWPAGIERLLLDTATEGSERFPRVVLRSELARLAARLSFDVNQDYSSVSIQCTRDALDRSFEILADVVMRPVLAESDLERARTRMMTAAAPGFAADEQLLRLMEARIYAGHPYATPLAGTPESLAALGLPELRAYHRELLQAANMRVVIVGNVDPAEIRRKVRAAFAGLPPGDSAEGGVPLLKLAAPSVQRIKREMEVTYVAGVFAAPALDAADTPAFRLIVLLLNGRLFDQIRTRHALSYAPGAGYTSTAAPYGQVYFSTGEVAEAARLCLAEIARLKREPVTPKELKAQCATLRTTLYSGWRTNSAQAGQLGYYELIGGGWKNSLVMSYDSVTPADIQQAAQKWLENFQFFLLGPETAVIDEKAFAEPAGG